MAESSRSIREWRDVDVSIFENEIIPANQPAVLKALISSWPAVAMGLESPARVAGYIKQFDTGRPANAIVGAPGINGRFFYSADLRGFNFERKLVSISTALDNLITLADKPDPPAIAMQAISIAELLPEFEEQHPLSLVPKAVAPRM